MSDEHASIIGSLLFTPGHTLLPWRAEFTGTVNAGWEQLRIAHVRSEEEALDFLENALALEELANRLP